MKVPPKELISIIIPTLNEEPNLRATVEGARRDDHIELIVADGGSTDLTRSLAHELGARLVESRPGRARQMNAGASVARGKHLLFLHADTLLPDGYGGLVRRLLAQPTTSCGAFRHTFDRQTLWHRFISWTVNLRSLFLTLPYGDQGLFVRRVIFQQLQGYRELPILEDLDLIRRAKKLGKIRIAEKKVTTSARRGRRQGEIRTTLANDVLLVGFYLRISPTTLAPIYRWVTKTSSSPVDPSPDEPAVPQTKADPTAPQKKEAHCPIAPGEDDLETKIAVSEKKDLPTRRQRARITSPPDSSTPGSEEPPNLESEP